MALLWNWFWANKVTEEEAQNAVGLHKKLVAELNDIFALKGTKKNAERQYDADRVFLDLTIRMNAMQVVYDRVSIDKGITMYPSPAVRQQMQDAITDYLDYLVDNTVFLESNPRLRLASASNILTFRLREQLAFPWHYWMLFKRHLETDALNKEGALDEIESAQRKPSLFSDSDTSSGDEYYQMA